MRRIPHTLEVFSERELEKFVSTFRRAIGSLRPFAVVCGAGISAQEPARLPAGHPFMKKVLKVFGVEPKFQKNMLEGGPSGGDEGGLRFEGLLEVLARTVDEQLQIVEQCYFPSKLHGGQPNVNHHIVAAIARNNPVVTTNFDVLLEAALTKKTKIVVEPQDWKKLSITAGAAGLWKIHGTVRVWDRGHWRRSDLSAPVVTLQRISRSRNDPARQKKFKRLIKLRPVVVVGYSASDDFDISLWIEQTKSKHPMFWVYFKSADFDKNAKLRRYLEHVATRRHVYAYCADENPKRIEDCLRKIARAKRIPKAFKHSRSSWEESINKWKTGLDSWSRYFFRAELFKHWGKFDRADEELKQAFRAAKDDNERKARTLVLQSETGFERGVHQDALRKASAALRLEPSDLWRDYACLAYARSLPTSRREETVDSLQKLIRARSTDDFVRERAKVLQRRLNLGDEGSRLTRSWKLSEGDLYAEALDRHVRARSTWREKSDIHGTKLAIQQMEQAIRHREKLGDYPGVCDSYNVLGLMHQRVAEISTWEGKPRAATEKELKIAKGLHQKSSDIGKHCGMMTRAAALLPQTLPCLRLGELPQARQCLNETDPTNIPFERYDVWSWKFLKILEEICNSPSADEAFRLGYDSFRELQESLSLEKLDTDVESRIHDAAYFNWMVCDSLLHPKPGARVRFNRENFKRKNWPTFWRRKRSEVLRAIKDKRPTREELAWLLFDPMAP